MRMSKIFAALVLVISATFPSVSPAQYTTEYKIGPKDLLEISVFGVDDLSKTVRVSEDGKITFPPLGEVEVEGLTKSEIEKKLSTLLEQQYLQSPQVTVFIKEYLSKKVSVLGAVMKPGPYELLGDMTLLDIISQAGGLTGLHGDHILVIRQNPDGTSMSLEIPIEDLFEKGDAALNIPLMPKDIVNVLMVQIVKVYVFGQVKNPGALEVKKNMIPTLLRAIAQAGGFAERAAKSRVLIKRQNPDGTETEIKVNVKDIMKGKRRDIPLKEGDVIIVPESIF